MPKTMTTPWAVRARSIAPRAVSACGCTSLLVPQNLCGQLSRPALSARYRVCPFERKAKHEAQHFQFTVDAAHLHSTSRGLATKDASLSLAMASSRACASGANATSLLIPLAFVLERFRFPENRRSRNSEKLLAANSWTSGTGTRSRMPGSPSANAVLVLSLVTSPSQVNL